MEFREILHGYDFCMKLKFPNLIQLKSEILISVQTEIKIFDFLIKNFNK